MCEDRGMVIGGLIVAAAMLVWAFVGHANADSPRHQAPRTEVQTSITVSLDPMTLEVRHGGIAIELAV